MENHDAPKNENLARWYRKMTPAQRAERQRRLVAGQRAWREKVRVALAAMEAANHPAE